MWRQETPGLTSSPETHIWWGAAPVLATISFFSNLSVSFPLFFPLPKIMITVMYLRRILWLNKSIHIRISSLAPNFINIKYLLTPPLLDKPFVKHLPPLHRVWFIRLLVLLTQLTVFLNQNNSNMEIKFLSDIISSMVYKYKTCDSNFL